MLYVNMQAHIVHVCVCAFVTMSFEHVFTVKAWHVHPHKDSIGFIFFFLTEISWSKLKSVSAVFEVY